MLLHFHFNVEATIIPIMLKHGHYVQLELLILLPFVSVQNALRSPKLWPNHHLQWTMVKRGMSQCIPVKLILRTLIREMV